jgi:hypothetical protein
MYEEEKTDVYVYLLDNVQELDKAKSSPVGFDFQGN